jgi:hypothetical protein
MSSLSSNNRTVVVVVHARPTSRVDSSPFSANFFFILLALLYTTTLTQFRDTLPPPLSPPSFRTQNCRPTCSGRANPNSDLLLLTVDPVLPRGSLDIVGGTWRPRPRSTLRAPAPARGACFCTARCDISGRAGVWCKFRGAGIETGDSTLMLSQPICTGGRVALLRDVIPEEFVGTSGSGVYRDVAVSAGEYTATGCVAVNVSGV